MLLLILNQKVLYLVLLITLLYGLTSANQNITIYVRQNGIDQSECMEGNVHVMIQEMTNLSHIQLLVNLYLIGVHNPVLDFSGSSYYDFNLQGGGSFYAENIIFYSISGYLSIVTMSFNKCIFTSGGKAVTNKEGLYIANIHNAIISNCLFHNNDAQSELIVFQHVLNVEISGCEFYQNTGQGYLFWIYSYIPFYFELDNCSIYDNEVDYSIIDMESFNLESMITVTNCLFSNNTSTRNIFVINIDRLYMSNVNLISNKIKGIGTSIMLITPVHPNGEQHLNISNINFINNTGTGLKLKDVTMYFNNITFYNNTGFYGGGMSLHQTRIYLAGPLRFERNEAVFGGAIYIATIDNVFADSYCTTLEQIVFSYNIAGTLGADVFIEDGSATRLTPFFTFPCINKTKTNDNVRGDHIISGPYHVIVNPQSNSTITLFPGQKLTYSAHVTDYFGNLTSCSINILLQCGVHFIYCEYVQLTGDAASLLSTSNITTNLYLTSTVEHHDSSIKLRLICLDTSAEGYAIVNLTTCPLGYVFQTSQKSIQGTCECVHTVSDDVQCDFVLGVACIRHGYWFGEINANDDTAPCQYPYCKTDLPPCPIIGLAQTYN